MKDCLCPYVNVRIASTLASIEVVRTCTNARMRVIRFHMPAFMSVNTSRRQQGRLEILHPQSFLLCSKVERVLIWTPTQTEREPFQAIYFRQYKHRSRACLVRAHGKTQHLIMRAFAARALQRGHCRCCLCLVRSSLVICRAADSS